MHTRASIVPVAVFYALYMLAAVAMAFATQNMEFLIYIVVMLILGVIIYVLHRKVGFSKGVLWGLGVWGLLHMIGGLIEVPEGWPVNGTQNVFYSWWIIPGFLKYDMVIHAYGFGMATWATWQGAGTILDKKLPTTGALALCILAGMGLGAANEIIEFVTSLLVPETNVGGYLNTGWDLISNFIGCMAAATIIGMQKASDAIQA
jgi:uncharacterized membrane protein